MSKNFKYLLFISGLTIWGLGCLVMVAQLQGSHMLSFLPNRDLASASANTWTLTHVLGAECKCSHAVSNYLLERGPQKEIQEDIVMLGKNEALVEKLKARGFRLRQEDPNLLKETGATGVPFLLISTPQNQVVYAGGYAEHKIASDTPLHDLEILNSLRGGRSPASFPIFGCATSLKYQKIIDPFGMKYKQQDKKL